MLDTRLFKAIQFERYRILRATQLPLSPVTLLVGPNGSGKSTALRSFADVRESGVGYDRIVNFSARNSSKPIVVDYVWGPSVGNGANRYVLHPDQGTFRTENPGAYPSPEESVRFGEPPFKAEPFVAAQALERFRVFSFVPDSISAGVQLQPQHVLERDGSGLPGVLDRLRDHQPEAFERLNTELPRWLPEFDRILFDVPNAGSRGLVLRARDGVEIPAKELSEGTRLSLALLTLAYAPGMPRLFALEEPDRGLHPRMLALVRDTLLRLAQPAEYGDRREPSQVIVTTHSPYLLDLFRDFPECVVIANRDGDAATFQRLVDVPDYERLLSEAPLGESWYSGLLGGVPDPP